MKKLRIGLLYPSWAKSYGIFGHFAKRNSTWPPANLAYLGAIVERGGHETFIVDGTADELSVEDMVEKTLAQNPDIVGFTSYSPFFHIQVEVARALKEAKPDLPIMIGGSHATIVKEKALLDCFDYVFVGESEQSLPLFLERFSAGEGVGDIKGVVSRGEDGNPVFPGPAPAITSEEFDDLPWPNRELLDNDKYLLGTLRGRAPFTLIQTTRGCPWKCIFCASEDLNTTRIARRSPKNVVDEIQHVVDTYGIRHFYIVDDVLTLHDEHVLEICDLIEERGLDITFEGSTRANLVNDEQIKRLAECGLIRLSFGLETIDSEMRKTMKKKVPLKYYSEANRILNKYDVEAMNSVMIGLPGESEETVRKLLRWLRDTRHVKQANLAITVPYPGTELYRMAKNGENGITLHTDDFSEYRRYGAAVTTIGELSPRDLVELQNEGFVSIYLAPWRWRPMFAKHGVMGFVLLGVRIVRLVRWRMTKAFQRLFEPNNLALAGAGGQAQGSRGGTEFGHSGDPKEPNF